MDYIKFCEVECNRKVTFDDVVTDTTGCQFCDVPYALLELKEKGELDKIR